MNINNKKSGFPNPLSPPEEKGGKKYGLGYAKAIYQQWGKMDQDGSTYKNRNRTFEKNRK